MFVLVLAFVFGGEGFFGIASQLAASQPARPLHCSFEAFKHSVLNQTSAMLCRNKKLLPTLQDMQQQFGIARDSMALER